MNNHVNIEYDELTIPSYAIHDDKNICGFFGPYRFLSNFYPLETSICFEDSFFGTVEHAYQAAKYPHDKRFIFGNVTAAKAKKLGRIAPAFNGFKWNKKKYAIMESLVRQKFTNNYKLRKMLLLTDGYHLEEMNSWGDEYWGTNVLRVGENNLGKILMIVREECKATRKDRF